MGKVAKKRLKKANLQTNLNTYVDIGNPPYSLGLVNRYSDTDTILRVPDRNGADDLQTMFFIHSHMWDIPTRKNSHTGYGTPAGILSDGTHTIRYAVASF